MPEKIAFNMDQLRGSGSRLQLQETPIFAEIKARGQMTKNPWKEASLSSNVKYVGIATIVLIGQGVVWYSGQFWALYFLQQVSKVDALTSAYIVGAALLIATPSLIFFGWLSDVIGRKPVILGGMLLASITYYPLMAGIGHAAWQHQLSDSGLHHLHPGLLCRDGIWVGRGVPGGILPRQDTVHVGVGALSLIPSIMDEALLFLLGSFVVDLTAGLMSRARAVRTNRRRERNNNATECYDCAMYLFCWIF